MCGVYFTRRRALIIFVYVLTTANGKYLEGELKTSENWAFLARFCFLNEDGQFEYRIEFNEEYGTPSLLLYYDEDNQWPAVYKSNKTCIEKLAPLKIGKNQMITLTTKVTGYRDLSGCIAKEPELNEPTTIKPKYTVNVPTTRYHYGISKSTTKSTISTGTIRLTTNDFSQSTFSYELTSSPSATTEYSTTIADALEYFTDVDGNNTSSDTENIFDDANFNLSSSSESSESTKAPIRKREVMTRPVVKSKRNIVCHNARRFQSRRERWWFIAISNCNGTKGISIKYRILMTNALPGDYWREHFSADEFYILPILMAFCIAYSLLILAIVICTVELKSRQLLHTTYKLFVLSVALQFLGIMLQSVAYLKYAINGVATPHTEMFGSMFMGCSETCFLVLVLLLAKGYTVTRGRLPLAASVKLTIFMCLYAVTYICIFIYAAKVFDPGEVLYLYESPAGYALVSLRIFAWLMFIYSTVFTLKHYPEKANFYYPFNICGTLWFIAGPAFILSANTYIDKWVRASVVCAVLLFITFGGHLMFLILTMPSMANKNFPYHVRTTQIGVMETAGMAGTSTIEHFSHHVYAPTSGNDQPMIIPLTRRTEEIFGGMYTQRLHSNCLRNNQRAASEGNLVDELNSHEMQNVLNWSLAKNYSPLKLPTFERANGAGSLGGSARSRLTDGSNPMDHTPTALSRNHSQLHADYDDYKKAVPVELFTVSKMVIATNNHSSATTNHTDH